jgi:hypothetical protein
MQVLAITKIYVSLSNRVQAFHPDFEKRETQTKKGAATN